MTPCPTLQAWVDQLAQHHEALYQRTPTAEMIPMYFLDRADAPMDIIGAVWRSAGEKAMAAEMIRRRLAANPDIDRYAFVSEVWMAASPVGADSEVMALARAQKLHTYDGRVEAVITIAVARDPLIRPVTVVQRIERGPDGGVRRLVRDTQPAVTEGLADGKMMTLFGEGVRQ